MITTTIREIDKQEAIESLKKYSDLKENDTIYVVQKHVSKSGMQRRLMLFKVCDDGSIHDITYPASRILDWSMDERGIKVGGCGMDMHFHTVYTLAQEIYGDGYKLKHQSL